VRRTQDPASSLEDALRWLATNAEARPPELLTNAIEDPTSTPASTLELLVRPTSSLSAGTPETRALAVWGLIIHEINRTGSSENARNRIALRAAFRLQRHPEVVEPWRAKLGDRFSQLKTVPAFGRPQTTTPMNKAWTEGLTGRLVPNVSRWLDVLSKDGSEWMRFVELARSTELELVGGDSLVPDPSGYKHLSEGAQPLFADLFVTTVFMRRRTAYRRITERLITSQVDGLQSYSATALAGTIGSPPTVRALWGCRAEHMTSPREGEPTTSRLVFPRALRRGEKHYFSSEAIDEHLTAEREGVDVEIDHHGIAPGRLLYEHIPVSGLTIRIRFDEDHIPWGCWWHAEQTVRERRSLPTPRSPRWLPIVGNSTAHTFTARCLPREVYGVSFLWNQPSM
jgi:hypothetical protein